MNKGYGQYCPLALAAELLSGRWTLLVVSRLVDGCTRFSEIHRGVPRMSPSLLSQRLGELERAGLVRTEADPHGRGRLYFPTHATQELEPIIMDLAVWGQRWARDMTTEDLDPAFLVWSMHLRLDTDAMPAGRTVLEFDFSGAPEDCQRFWLINEDGKVDMCLKDPGLDVDVVVTSDLRRFVEAWRGFRDLKREIESGRIKVLADPDLRRGFPDWLQLSALAPFGRERAGRERRLARATARDRTSSAASVSKTTD